VEGSEGRDYHVRQTYRALRLALPLLVLLLVLAVPCPSG
jgi:hypothetical protein